MTSASNLDTDEGAFEKQRVVPHRMKSSFNHSRVWLHEGLISNAISLFQIFQLVTWSLE